MRPSTIIVIGVAAGLIACDEITVPNLNNPSIESLTNNPTIGVVNTAVVGMLINLRGRVGVEASAMGILGKESYNLDQAEPRNVLSYLQGPIEPGGFVQDLGWTDGYRNIVQGITILEAVDKIAETPQRRPRVQPQPKEGPGFVKRSWRWSSSHRSAFGRSRHVSTSRPTRRHRGSRRLQGRGAHSDRRPLNEARNISGRREAVGFRFTPVRGFNVHTHHTGEPRIAAPHGGLSSSGQRP